MARKPIGRHTGRISPAAMRRLQGEELKLSGTTTQQSGPMPAVLVEARLLDAEMVALKTYATHLTTAIKDGSYDPDGALSTEESARYASLLYNVNEFVDDWKYSGTEDRRKLIQTAESVVLQRLSLGEGEGSRMIAVSIALKQALIRECRNSITKLCSAVGYEWSLDDAVEAARDQAREDINKVSKPRAQETDTADASKTWKEEFSELTSKLEAQLLAAQNAKQVRPSDERVVAIEGWMQQQHPKLVIILDFMKKDIDRYYIDAGGNPKVRLHEWLGKVEPKETTKYAMDKALSGGHASAIRALKNFDVYSAEIEEKLAAKPVERSGLLSRIFGRGETQAQR